MKKNKRPVSILITWDVDPAPEVSVENKKEALGLTRRLLFEQQIQSTFFVHARIADVLDKEIQELIQNDHEIGCHGLTHGNEDDYGRMPEDMQRKYLTEATEILRKTVNGDIFSFRGPRMKTSSITQKILVELGYKVDGSVASQRIDFVSSNLINFDWIFAPRLPYQPSSKNAFRKGDMDMWVVPLSAVIMPFISSALYIFRIRFMKLMFRILYFEAKRTGKPIVYLIHPFEFSPWVGDWWKEENLSFFQRIRTYGFVGREKFYEKDNKKRFEMNKELFRYMKSFPNVQFMTMKDYVSNKLIKE